MVFATWILAATLIAGSVEGEFRTTSERSRPLVGSQVSDFRLQDAQGNPHQLIHRARSRIVSVVFLRVGCPVAELDAANLAELARRFEVRGVAFLGVVPSAADDPATVVRFATDHDLPFPVLQDGGEVAAQLGASRTPEVVVLDSERRIRYRGRIDDRHNVGSQRAEASHLDLANALEDLLAGRAVGTPETQAVGCPIDPPALPPMLDANSSPAVPTYHREIAPILERSCVGCHQPGQVGPFGLTNYGQAASRAGAIAEAVEAGRMPPWHANPRHGRFRNDIRLSDQERAQILAWIEHDCPEGESIPRAVAAPGLTGWRIGRPDLVVTMPGPFTVPASGVIEYQYFEVDPGFTTDRWVQAAEIQPGNRRVVHHCSVYLAPPGRGHEPTTQGELGSFCLASTTPGTPPLTLPPGMAKRVPAGWRFVFVVHYAPVGTIQHDQTRLGLVFADPASVRQEVATNLMVDPDLRIPPHEANHRVEQSRRFEADVLLLAMFPHMHVRGKSFRYEAIFPDGRSETLLDVPRFHFAWQNRYELVEPRRLPAGTTLRCVAHYDNSAANPANPDPAATVRAGPQSWDEMFNGYYEIALADQDLTPTAGFLAGCRSWRQAIGSWAWAVFLATAFGLLLRRGSEAGWVRRFRDQAGQSDPVEH